MKAIFEVEFDPEMMCDSEALKQEYGNSWFKCIEYLYESDGIGIFENDLKLIDVKP